jgi:hypothetical protein
LFIDALDCYRSERLARICEVLEGASSARAGIAAVFRETVKALWADESRRGCLLVNSTAELGASDPSVGLEQQRLSSERLVCSARCSSGAGGAASWTRA